MTDDPGVCRQQYEQLKNWFAGPLGYSLQVAEASHLRSILPQLYGTVAIQLGNIGQLNLMDACVAPTRLMLDPGEPGGTENSMVSSLLTTLPLDQKSIDVAILPHTLDFAFDPHQVLREVHRVLVPEGHVVLTGFNPFSAWGLRKLASRRKSRLAPWSGRFIALSRIKDWLSLLDLEPTHGSMFYYRPPIIKDTLRDRFFFLERMGDRWWPMGAAVYLLVARKRVAGMTRLQPSWRQRRMALGAAMSDPAAKVIYPEVPQWQLRRDSQR